MTDSDDDLDAGDDLDGDDDLGDGEEPVASERTQRRRPRGSRPAAARDRPSRRSYRDGYDDDDDDDDGDYDDYDDYYGGPPRYRDPSSRPRRDLLIVIGVAAVVIIALLVVVLLKDNKDTKSVDSAGSPGSSQPSNGSTSTAPKGFCGDWIGPVGGEPTALKSRSGVYVWSGFDGWHVRARGPELGAVAVKISGQAPIKVNKLVPGSVVKSSPTPVGVKLTIPSGPDAQGADLTIDCSSTSLQFEVTSKGRPLPEDKIVIGVSAHPIGPTFTLQRAAT